MSTKPLKVAVVGAGAIGGISAALMTLAGHQLTLVCKHRAIKDIAEGPGLHVFGVKGEHRVALPAVQRIDQLSGPLDLVFLATKATDMLSPIADLKPLLHEKSQIVSLQNGICEEALARQLGRGRVVGCVVGYGATMHGPGELEMTSKGEYVIGSLEHVPDSRLEPIREMLGSVMDCRVSINIMGELYSKLIINSCINTLGALCGLRLGKLLKSRRVRELFIEVMREAMAVADKMGLKVEPGGNGKLDYYKYLAGRGGLASFKRHLMIRMIGLKYRRLKSSTLQSLERGKEPETAYLNGYIVDKARELGVDTPLNKTLCSMIDQIWRGKRAMGLQNLAELDGVG